MSLHPIQKSFTCPLCTSKASLFCSINIEQNYYKCPTCYAVFLDPRKYIDRLSEKERYKTHNNDVKDSRYQNFVKPITDAILQKFEKNSDGLDYGCGTGPVASVVLEQHGFNNIALYDPFFKPDKACLNRTYDFIICCEVMEHFFYPQKEFKLLKNLLKTTGQLFCKTSVLKEDITATEFNDWWYKNDPTHVFFYTPNTLDYIANAFNFNQVNVKSKLITFN
jgi:Zn-finger nucleic acid-binding protein